MGLLSTLSAASARAYGFTRSAVAAAVDEYFNRVTLLLNTSSTNGAQNNTFLDSSTNNFTITRNGNTTQGTFTPFSQTGWSNYFSGASNYLSIADNAVFDFGTGNFCVEFWFNAPNQTTSYPAIISSSGYTGALSIRYDNTGYDNKIFVYMGGGGDPVLASTNAIANNVWAHVAVVRDSTTSLKIYVNGVLDGTATISSSLATDLSNGPMYVGRGFDVDGTNAYFTGYVSNIRVTKGGAVYTSAFTPSTTPLTTTVPSGTVSLLTCQSNRFLDNSSNAFALTVNGTPSVQAFSPFAPTAAYDTAVVGGSAYFDGSGDYLTAPTDAAFQFGTGNFTIEAFVYNQGTSGSYPCIFENRTADASTTTGILLNQTPSGYLNMYYGGTNTTSSTPLPVNAWTHVAIVRNGSVLTLYQNGVSAGTQTGISGNLTDGVARIGMMSSGSGAWIGYISNVRVNKGTAVYTSTFTPPTAPLTAISGTSLLLSATNSGIYDSTAKNVMETVSSVQVSTTQSKFPPTSIWFQAGGTLAMANNPGLSFGTGDFTVEFFVYWNTVPTASVGFISGSGNGSTDIRYTGSLLYLGKFNQSLDSSFAWTASTGQWYHVAMTRSGSSLRAFVNGTQIGTTATNSGTYNCVGTSFYVGTVTFGASGDTPLAYIQQYRITKGYARYTANFTAPTAAFPIQ